MLCTGSKRLLGLDGELEPHELGEPGAVRERARVDVVLKINRAIGGGEVEQEATRDLHLQPHAYDIWREAVRPLVEG